MMAPGLDMRDSLRPSVTVLSPALGVAFLLRMELSPALLVNSPGLRLLLGTPWALPASRRPHSCSSRCQQGRRLSLWRALAWTFGGAGLVRPTQDSCTSAHYSFSQEKTKAGLRLATHAAKCWGQSTACVRSKRTRGGSVQWTPGRVSSGQMRRLGRVSATRGSLHRSPNPSVCLKTLIIKQGKEPELQVTITTFTH